MTPERLEAAFRNLYGRTPRQYRAPGRVNLIGEHCDYNDGFVMPVNTGLYTWLAIAPRDDRQCRIHSTNFDVTRTFALDEIEPESGRSWLEYVKGVAWSLLEAGREVPGADILIHGDIPMGGGLSSSASLQAVLAYAWLEQSGTSTDRVALALACRRAENDFVGVHCGIMDQFVICLSPRGHAMKLDCRSLTYEAVPLPANAAILVVETGVHHQLDGSGYNARRAECEAAVAHLAGCGEAVQALRDVRPEMLNAHRVEMDDTVFRRARHVVGEIQRVHAADQAMRKGDLVALGDILNTSHASLRDDFEVSCEELDTLTSIARDCPGVYGSRMVGGGWGGCAIALVEERQLEGATAHIARAYGVVTGRTPWHHVVTPADPVGAVRA